VSGTLPRVSLPFKAADCPQSPSFGGVSKHMLRRRRWWWWRCGVCCGQKRSQEEGGREGRQAGEAGEAVYAWTIRGHALPTHAHTHG